jgi:hypothetical protein
VFIIATANKEFTLTAGKFVPVCNKTMMNVRKVSLKFLFGIVENTSGKFREVQ